SLARVASERLGKKSTIAVKNRSGGSSRSTSAKVNPSSWRKSVRSFGGLGRTTLQADVLAHPANCAAFPVTSPDRGLDLDEPSSPPPQPVATLSSATTATTPARPGITTSHRH